MTPKANPSIENDNVLLSVLNLLPITVYQILIVSSILPDAIVLLSIQTSDQTASS